jgi:Domain of unknown function (DUF4214)
MSHINENHNEGYETNKEVAEHSASTVYNSTSVASIPVSSNIPESYNGFKGNDGDDLLSGGTGDANDNTGALALGLIEGNIDGHEGYDILTASGYKSDYAVEQHAGTVKITNLSSSAMAQIKNVEMLSFGDGSNIAIAHNGTEGVLARLFQVYLNRDATSNEWKLGTDALSQKAPVEAIFNWFNTAANLGNLNNTDYIQTLYSNVFSRQATDTELSYYLNKLSNHETDRNWLAVDLASSKEAIEVVGSVIIVDSTL